MDRIKKKLHRREKIRKGLRKRIRGTNERPRLTVYRSNTEIYAQIIDDVTGFTLAAASSKSIADKMTPVEKAKNVGKEIATKAKEANVVDVVFDRNGYLYHGRIKSLAEGAREEGLNF
ncbi:MAG: 50S ribosomal protein L18 [Flavobacterium sp.]|nr:MAG: 50S ribosomal protein L18 [Flavobacterium sp.]